MQSIQGHKQKIAGRSGMSCDRLAGRLWVFISLALLLALSTLSPAVAERQSINKVDITDHADSVRIAITTSLPLSMHDSRVGDNYIAFDLYGHLAPGQVKQSLINKGGIKTVKCGWFKNNPPVVRIVVSSTGVRDYSIATENGKRLTIITVLKEGVKAATADTKAPAEPKPAAKSQPAPVTTVSAPAVTVEPVKVSTAAPVKVLDKKNIAVEPAVEVDEPGVLVASAEPIMISQAETNERTTRTNRNNADNNISLDFVASDLHDVLKALAVQSGANIVASPDVKGSVTVSLNRVTVPEALKLVTNLSGYQFAEASGTYIVGTAENLKSFDATPQSSNAAKVTDVVLIRYADSALIAKALSAEYPGVTVSTAAPGKDSGVNGLTTLILSGDAVDVQDAKSLVETIEGSMASATQAEVVELYEVRYADVTEIPGTLMASIPGLKVAVGPNQGFNLKCPTALSLGSDTIGTGGGQSSEIVKAPSKNLVLQGSAGDIDAALRLLAVIDVPQPQIMIEAKVVDITDSGAKDLGIEWGGEFGVLSSLNIFEQRDPGDDILNFGRFGRDPLGIAGKLKAIVASGNGRVLANPNVLALDGKPASIFIGDEVKYVTRIESTIEKTTVTTETARVGVQLHSISTISNDGFITMNLHPEVSVITGWKQLPAVNLALPEISRRFVDSTVRVKDGETIVIGGLIKDEEMRNISGIPLLKDLPIIGSLFRYDRKAHSRSEVMMFITPRIVTSE